MKKGIILLTAITLQGIAMAQTEEVTYDSLQNVKTTNLEEVVVNSTRVKANSPVAHENEAKRS